MRWPGRDRFTVALKVAGRPDLYLLNPIAQTYYVRKRLKPGVPCRTRRRPSA